jgi:hypothetical protein
MGTTYKSFLKKYGNSSELKKSSSMKDVMKEIRREIREARKNAEAEAELEKEIVMDECVLNAILKEIDEYVPEGVAKPYWNIKNKSRRTFKDRFTRFITVERSRIESKMCEKMNDIQKIEYRGRMSIVSHYGMLVSVLQDKEDNEFLRLLWWYTSDILDQTVKEQRKPAVIKNGIIDWEIKTEIQGRLNALNVIKHKMRRLVTILWKKEDLEFLKEKPSVCLRLLLALKSDKLQ